MKKKTLIRYSNFTPSEYHENYIRCDFKNIAKNLKADDQLSIEFTKKNDKYIGNATLNIQGQIINQDMQGRSLDITSSSLALNLKTKMAFYRNKDLGNEKLYV